MMPAVYELWASGELVLAGVAGFLAWALSRTGTRLKQVGERLDELVDETAVAELLRQAGPVPQQGAVVVVIPAYNEAASIAGVLSRIPAEVDGLPVFPVVVVDGGNDGTEVVAARHGAWVVRTPFNRGQGAALRVGFRFAHRYGATAAVSMDADGQHDPAELSTLVRPVLDGRADVVIGSRVRGDGQAASALRGAGMVLLNALLSKILRQPLTDCSSGYRALDPAALPLLRTRETRYNGGELLILAVRQGLRVVEVPVTIHPRRHGSSKKGHDVYFAARFVLAMARALWRTRKAGRTQVQAAMRGGER